MKKLLFSNVAVTMLMAFTASFTLSSCSEEIVEDQQENQETQEGNLDFSKDVTVFTTGGDETTRTSLDLNAYFYWTANDKIWVDVANDGSYATSSDDMEMSSDKRLAKFIFAGKTMVKSSYELTYTGIDATSGTKVTIPQDQSQNVPNDATSIGRNGDCATATATKNPKGQYEFTLHHEAHYLIFQPYTEIPNDKTWKLKKIEIIDLDGKPLCGTYDFDENGLIASSVQSPNSTITISTIGIDPNGVKLLEKAASDKPIWYAVIAPATDGKRNLRIKYTIYPAAEVNYYNGASLDEDIVIVKDLPKDYASKANQVTKIAHKMTLMVVPTDLFYMWDAKTHYWTGVSNPNNRPHYYGASNTNYPTTGDSYTPLTTNVPATGRAAQNSCKSVPNVNAATWYAYAGDPRWETEYPWCFDNDYNYIYTKGTWFKKWDVIVAENPVLTGKTFTNCDVSFKGTNIPVYNNAQEILGYRNYDGTDYRSNVFPDKQWEQAHFQNRVPSYRFNGRPNDTSDYFFLPANGHLNNGQLTNGGDIHGCFWLSSGVPGSRRAYIVEAKPYNIMVRHDNGSATNGRPVMTDWWK